MLRDGVLVAETDKLRCSTTGCGKRPICVRRARGGPRGADGRLGADHDRDAPVAAGLELAPYLQQLTPTRVAIVWQTYAPATTSLYLGAAGAPGATSSATRP